MPLYRRMPKLKGIAGGGSRPGHSMFGVRISIIQIMSACRTGVAEARWGQSSRPATGHQLGASSSTA